MSFFFKKLIISVPLLFYSFQTYAYFQVDVINATGQTISYSLFTSQNSDYSLGNKYNLDNKKKMDICDNEEILIDNKKFSFIENFKSCSEMNILGTIFIKGSGLTIKVNGKEMGTICAFKKTMLDPALHAQLEYFKDSKNQVYIKFSNVGWGEDSNIYPTFINLKLD
ncbi:hypothetical protein GCL60_10780 [Silvanigrella paludirubra]|uniref:Uncharacterized protein n=1 Tax=Silvanigrella paludirubra TaxID=2499159 RepID=A0A6N6VU05_9BACT|nr:hypothetical protein [Silvanigrella paludirubra]KAB8037651.1 hypothetical protein GCL60_10780 [Silvanigrella paludirubra]